MKLLLILILLLIVLAFVYLRRRVVFDYERGVLFRNGIFAGILEPGAYWYLPFRTAIEKVDIRLRTVPVPSQEVLSADNVTLKITLCAQYTVTDPFTAVTKVEKFPDALYMTLQLALRELVGAADVDDVIAKRQAIGQGIFEKSEAAVRAYGLTLHRVDVKDIMFPGDLKKIFAQVVNARKEGLAALEKARGETAALRSLANAAKLLENNPTLMQLRTLQSVESGNGNTVVLGWPTETVPVPLKKPKSGGTPKANGSEEK
ncbi:MAG: hypothetical protein QG656_153 [Candidatus Hydrogenedentes bacterium]|nr:hypothetical protein [Candidatus Hydrogenedentota bacterium]